MSTKNFFEQWLKPEFSKSIPGVNNLPFDMKSVMEANRKTFQAFVEANQVAAESLQAGAQRFAEIASQIVQDQTEIARSLVTEGTPEEKVARGAELCKRSYEKTVGGFREVGDIVTKSSREATDIINQRVATALSEITSTIEDMPKPGKKEEGSKKSGKKAA